MVRLLQAVLSGTALLVLVACGGYSNDREEAAEKEARDRGFFVVEDPVVSDGRFVLVPVIYGEDQDGYEVCSGELVVDSERSQDEDGRSTTFLRYRPLPTSETEAGVFLSIQEEVVDPREEDLKKDPDFAACFTKEG